MAKVMYEALLPYIAGDRMGCEWADLYDNEQDDLKYAASIVLAEIEAYDQKDAAQ